MLFRRLWADLPTFDGARISMQKLESLYEKGEEGLDWTEPERDTQDGYFGRDWNL